MRIALIDTESKRKGALSGALEQSGVGVNLWSDSRQSLYDFIGEVQPDAIVLDIHHPSSETLKQLLTVNRKTPKPMIIMAETDELEVTSKASQAGVSMYVTNDFPPPLVLSLLKTSIAHFNYQQALKIKLDSARLELEEHRLLARAKGLLIKHAKMDEDQAYQHIREKAMRQRVTKSRVAGDIIALVEQQSQTTP